MGLVNTYPSEGKTQLSGSYVTYSGMYKHLLLSCVQLPSPWGPNSISQQHKTRLNCLSVWMWTAVRRLRTPGIDWQLTDHRDDQRGDLTDVQLPEVAQPLAAHPTKDVEFGRVAALDAVGHGSVGLPGRGAATLCFWHVPALHPRRGLELQLIEVTQVPKGEGEQCFWCLFVIYEWAEALEAICRGPWAPTWGHCCWGHRCH